MLNWVCKIAVFLSLISFSLSSAASSPETSQSVSNKKYAEDQILVMFNPDVIKEKKDHIHEKHGSKKLYEYENFPLHLIKLRKNLSPEEAVALYRAEPDVEFAEPDYIVEFEASPQDPFFQTGQLWGLNKISAPDAWNITIGSQAVVAATIDSGLLYTHEDLSGNAWRNAPANQFGRNTECDGCSTTDPAYWDPIDSYGHGTHVGGIIGAVGNNSPTPLGVVGVNWTTTIMACRTLSPSTTSKVTQCLDHFVNKIKLPFNEKIIAVNASFSTPACSWTVWTVLDSLRQYGVLLVAAAGNASVPGGPSCNSSDLEVDNDSFRRYPASYALAPSICEGAVVNDLPNVISVAATDSGDNRGFWNDTLFNGVINQCQSRYGRRTVHVAAPGVNINSSIVSGSNYCGPVLYCGISGTSMATPHVTGLAALIKSIAPNDDRLNWIKIKNLILSTGDSIQSMDGITVTGKRINAARSVQLADLLMHTTDKKCYGYPLFSALRFPSSFTAGVGANLSALSIDCDHSYGPVTLTSSAGETATLYDDGNISIHGDVSSEDGIFTNSWTPSMPTCYITLSSPAGSERIPSNMVTLTVNKSGSGTGTITRNPGGTSCGPASTTGFAYNTVVTLTAAPNPGFKFAGWSGSGCSGTGNCIITLTSDTSVTATFSPYTLTVTKTGSGAGIATVTSAPSGINCGATCQSEFTGGTQIALTAAWDNTNYEFTGWSGACSGTTNPCNLTISSDTSVAANFEVRPPIADFTCAPTSGTVPTYVTCTDSSQHIPSTWSWNFGDGTAVSSAQNASHTYRDSGAFNVTLTVANARGSNSLTKSGYITVTVCGDADPNPVRLADSGNSVSGTYPTVSTAYQAADSVYNRIQSKSLIIPETADLIFNLGKNISLEGGYGCGFGYIGGEAVIGKLLEIDSGQITISNISLEN